MASDVDLGIERRFAPGGGLHMEAPTTGTRRLAGFAIVFNSRSVDLGGFVEIIAPSALDRTLREQIDVRAFHSHDPALLLGRLSNGTLTIRKEPHGLHVEIEPPDTSFGRDVVAMVERGDLAEMSFGFRVEPNGDEWRDDNGTLVRTVHDMTVYEVSTVATPAYRATSIGARAVDTSAAMRSLQQHRQGTLSPARVAYLRRLHRQRLVSV